MLRPLPEFPSLPPEVDMRKYLHINVCERSVETDELHGEDVIRVGRHFIARTLLASGVAKVDPLSPENPLIFLPYFPNSSAATSLLPLPMYGSALS